ncbi:glycosyltransferase family 25 protein [Rhodobacteraceae bacterium HSP-20]|uniref:Glycosyltransferase family 25 protein n=1 Tax=Paragemmobacter amnigenus TaxID=2852097 RepID=A0ABS6J4R2_9RHOB|nr:glycosyltransferase family 25 protein [Rhodobacter amnigenus]MBU9698236.1 glycosyltransferase family 25 protein [Rhodobacter amnigenus]MBV4389463.1 glycosyltransferase family 25 protein [Rhodobacter amnigenus]
MQVQGFIIHLDRATARRPQAQRLAAISPCPTEILPAIDGRAMDPVALEAAYSATPLLAPPYPFRIGAGEIACFLSHRKVWTEIMARNLDAALVLEDDVDLGPEFPAAFALSCRHIDSLGYIQFQTRPLPAGRTLASEGSVSLIRPAVLPLRTSAQLVSRAAAERLLALTERFDRPIDTFLQMTWHSGIPFACASPSGVSDLTEALGGTVAQVKAQRAAITELKRSLERAAYRSRIRALAALSKWNKNEK